MKDILMEIKNNLQGINSKVNEIKDQINDLEQKATNQNKKKKKELKKKMWIVYGPLRTTSSIPTFASWRHQKEKRKSKTWETYFKKQ